MNSTLPLPVLITLILICWCFVGGIVNLAFKDRVGPRNSQQVVFLLLSGPLTWFGQWLTRK
jgi:hypothetical protein